MKVSAVFKASQLQGGQSLKGPQTSLYNLQQPRGGPQSL